MLHFVDQWIVSVSNMDLMFVSMISVCLCHSYGILFQLLEDNIMTFVKNQLKKIQKVLSPDYPECSESQREDEEVLEGEDEEQRRSSRDLFVKITMNFLRRMKQEELADCLQSSKRISLNIEAAGEMGHLLMSPEMNQDIFTHSFFRAMTCWNIYWRVYSFILFLVSSFRTCCS